MPKFYWAEAIWTAIYIQNRISTTGEKVSTDELYFRHKTNLKHLRVFGSITYVHVPDETWKKIDAKSDKCILVGYSHAQKGYKCYNYCECGRLVRNKSTLFCCECRELPVEVFTV